MFINIYKVILLCRDRILGIMIRSFLLVRIVQNLRESKRFFLQNHINISGCILQSNSKTTLYNGDRSEFEDPSLT